MIKLNYTLLLVALVSFGNIMFGMEQGQAAGGELGVGASGFHDLGAGNQEGDQDGIVPPQDNNDGNQDHQGNGEQNPDQSPLNNGGNDDGAGSSPFKKTNTKFAKTKLALFSCCFAAGAYFFIRYLTGNKTQQEQDQDAEDILQIG